MPLPPLERRTPTTDPGIINQAFSLRFAPPEAHTPHTHPEEGRVDPEHLTPERLAPVSLAGLMQFRRDFQARGITRHEVAPEPAVVETSPGDVSIEAILELRRKHQARTTNTRPPKAGTFTQPRRYGAPIKRSPANEPPAGHVSSNKTLELPVITDATYPATPRGTGGPGRHRTPERSASGPLRRLLHRLRG